MDNNDWIDQALPVFIGLVCLLALFMYLCPVVKAAELPKEKVIYCLIGEAEGGGYKGMLAIAHAIRNRAGLKAYAKAPLRGVYGCNSPRVKNRLYSSKTLVQAIKAWEESRLGYDITQGAEHWQSKADLKKNPAWINKCDFTGEFGGNYFYKCN